MIRSKALEVNLASYHVDVKIDDRYLVLQDIMSRYYGLMEGFNNFLKELSHPYKNWQFIVSEARRYSLEYFNLLDGHPQGAEGARLFVDIFVTAIASAKDGETRSEAVDNLLLLLEKIIKGSKSGLDRFLPVLAGAFDRIRQFEGEHFFLFVKSFYQLNRLARIFSDRLSKPTDAHAAFRQLLFKYYKTTYAYWLSVRDPLEWLEEEAQESEYAVNHKDIDHLFEEISHSRIRELMDNLKGISLTEQSHSTGLEPYLELTGFGQFVEVYRQIPQKLQKTGGKSGHGNQWKVIFLFHIMNTSGLSMIHEEVLREINRTLSWLISNESDFYIRKLISNTFSILKSQSASFPTTTLNCVLNMGKGVYKTDDSDLVNYFLNHVVALGFQTPRITGVGSDWQIKVNSAHIQNIRTWLDLIELNPKWSTRIISVLVINLSVTGVFIKDTDLFPRDITRLLNSDIGPAYNLIKQLARLFPVYFNDIGAEGKLRDISTEVDEMSRRRDILIHFLRKQSHVESSNRIIDLIEAALLFWASSDKTFLQAVVPPEIYEQIENRGHHIDGVHRIMSYIKEKGIAIPHGLLGYSAEKFDALLQDVHDTEPDDHKRVKLMLDFYQILHQKYNTDFVNLNNYIDQLSTEAFPDLNRLRAALNEPNLKKKLFMLLDYLKILQNIIISTERFEVREDIYKKRHITVDIPSMYGSYHEMKFDALGLTFRIESLVNVLFEELIENIDLSLITKATFYQIYARIRLFDKALRLDGISSVEIERQLDLLAHSLEVKEFSFTQYLDIFKGFASAVKNIINDYFHNVHEQNLISILDQLPIGQILPKYLPRENGDRVDQEKISLRVLEIFFRDRIAMSLGLQQMDRFVSRILNTLFQQADKLPKGDLRHLLMYDQENAMTSISRPNNRVSGLIYLGNKGINLVKLQGLGLPVPPGLIITTEVFRCRSVFDSYAPATQNLRDQIARNITHLENATGKSFGSIKNPLLFSVRSGSSISQPGMLDTFLNVGLNKEIATGLAKTSGNAWFAWDNYRRFLQCYGMAYGLLRDDFDDIISELKRRAGIRYKREFTGNQMRKVALTYQTMIHDQGIDIPDDPFEQLFMTIKNVLDSWESDKAKTYRKIMGISDDWGTAVTLQSMVYGNLSSQSGSGVIFTHNPRWSGDVLNLWGDFTLGNQGEDVVAGLVITLPISIYQQEVEMRETDITLESHFPQIFDALKGWSSRLIYEEGWTPQEMEFTFESPAMEDLYLLQTRDMAMRERKKVRAFDPASLSEEIYLGHGIGIAGGAMTGRVVFSLEDIDKWRDLEPDTKLILARSDTVPDDIREIFAADGLLTARGGVTSHASVVAHRLGKTCVVGCGDLICDEKEKRCSFKDVEIGAGDFISIDGQEGSVYSGQLNINEA